MRASWADASRIEEVRNAARGWKSAGAIGAPTLAAIDAAFPDPRIRLHGFWRVLVFILTSVIVNALFFFIQTDSTLLALSIVFGLLLAGATEALRGSRYSGTGADGATSFWAATYLLVACGDLLFRHRTLAEETAITAMIAAAAVVTALAAWRWGYWFYAACGAVGLYALLGRLPLARLLWIVMSMAAMWLLRRALDSPRLPPDLRRCAAAVFAVSAAALYAAVNLFSVDRRLVEMLQGLGPDFASTEGGPTGTTRLLSILGTAVLPVIYLAWGVRVRRRLLIGLGLLAAALSLVTLRYYVHIAPLWEVLAVCGALLIGAAIAIQRALRGRSGGEWRGLTAEPLYERERSISPLAAIVAQSIGGAAEPAAEPRPGGLTTGGGRYGGGGASGTY